jgi:hypothetical protein
LPACAQRDAITEPPEPEPTMQTSAASVALGPDTSSTAIVFGAASAVGAREVGPG